MDKHTQAELVWDFFSSSAFSLSGRIVRHGRMVKSSAVEVLKVGKSGETKIHNHSNAT